MTVLSILTVWLLEDRRLNLLIGCSNRRREPLEQCDVPMVDAPWSAAAAIGERARLAAMIEALNQK